MNEALDMNTECSIRKVLLEAQQRLADSETARLDAEVLLSNVLDCERSMLYSHPERVLDKQQFDTFVSLLARRQLGEPIAHLLGTKEFWSLNFAVNRDTLIPRPETESLIEKALQLIPTDKPWQIADLGTGSGAIAIAIARERPDCQVTATEVCHKALSLARQNAAANRVKNINFIQSHWFEKLTGQRFDLIITNPPYIAEDDEHLDQGDVRHEPRLALIAGKDGLEALTYIIEHAGNFLQPNGYLLLEHGYDQGAAIINLLQQHHYRQLESINDLSGHHRASCAQFKYD